MNEAAPDAPVLILGTHVQKVKTALFFATSVILREAAIASDLTIDLGHKGDQQALFHLPLAHHLGRNGHSSCPAPRPLQVTGVPHGREATGVLVEVNGAYDDIGHDWMMLPGAR